MGRWEGELRRQEAARELFRESGEDERNWREKTRQKARY
jgi:hypothetical protein